MTSSKWTFPVFFTSFIKSVTTGEMDSGAKPGCRLLVHGEGDHCHLTPYNKAAFNAFTVADDDDDAKVCAVWTVVYPEAVRDCYS